MPSSRTDRKSTRLNSSHLVISYAVFCLKKKTRRHAATAPLSLSFFFFNDTATTEIYTLSLHDALPIYAPVAGTIDDRGLFELARDAEVELPQEEDAESVEDRRNDQAGVAVEHAELADRSEEHTSELQSPCNLVCRLLLEKKNKTPRGNRTPVIVFFFF